HQLGVGEGSVDLGEVEVLAPPARAFESLVSRLPDTRVPGQVLAERDEVRAVVAFPPAGHHRATQLPPPGELRRDHHDGRRAVGPGRRLELVDGWRDHPRAEHVLDRDRLTELYTGIARRVAAQEPWQAALKASIELVPPFSTSTSARSSSPSRSATRCGWIGACARA